MGVLTFVLGRFGGGQFRNRLRKAGTVVYGILDKLVGPKRTDTVINTVGTSEQVITKGFLRSRTNISLLSSALFFFAQRSGINFGLEEADFIELLFYVGQIGGLILASFFKHHSKVRTRF